MPGPAGTESRCAPAITTRGPRPGLCPITLTLERVPASVLTRIRTRLPSRSRSASARLTIATGSPTPGATSVTVEAPRLARVGSPIRSAAAPALRAFSAFTRKRQPAGMARATSPGLMPDSSSWVQPVPTARSGPSARPAPE